MNWTPPPLPCQTCVPVHMKSTKNHKSHTHNAQTHLLTAMRRVKIARLDGRWWNVLRTHMASNRFRFFVLCFFISMRRSSISKPAHNFYWWALLRSIVFLSADRFIETFFSLVQTQFRFYSFFFLWFRRCAFIADRHILHWGVLPSGAKRQMKFIERTWVALPHTGHTKCDTVDLSMAFKLF